jgi:hypothetical protein
MPLLDNPKHEIYAQELAKGASQKDAYETAGYKPSEQHACRLASNGKVAARVSEIMGKAAVRAEISIASVTESLLRIAEKAEQLRDASGLSVARNAWMDAAKINGLIIDKAENTNRNVDPSSLSDAEIVAIRSWQGRQSCTEAAARRREIVELTRHN